MFRGRRDLETSGHYFFSEDTAPHYPLFHNFGSRNWLTGDNAVDPDLGEVPTRPRPFFSGRLETRPFPSAIRLGTAECVTDGERFPLPVIARTFIEGIDSRCWQQAPPILPDIVSRPNLVTWATILDLHYLNSSDASALLADFMGPGTVTTQVNNSASAIPGTVIGNNGTYAVVAISGTTNAQQLALQSAYTLGGPTNYGLYGTTPVYEAAWLEIHQRLVAAGVTADQPIIIIGHSYGGAVATLLTARYHNGVPARPISLVTFGSPKPGDQRVIDLTRDVRQLHMVNQGDWVADLAPSRMDLWPFYGLLTAPIIDGWDQYRAPVARYYLDDNGVLVQSPPPNLPYSFLAAAVPAFLTGTPLGVIGPHLLKAYLDNLLQ